MSSLRDKSRVGAVGEKSLDFCPSSDIILAIYPKTLARRQVTAHPISESCRQVRDGGRSGEIHSAGL